MAKPKLAINSGVWWKIQWLARTSKTEISGIGLLQKWPRLLMTEFVLVGQESTPGTTRFTHDGWFNHQEAYGDSGIDINVYSRVWVHTHPGASASPSSTDLKTWETQFGVFPWAIMLIVGKTGEYHCEFRMQTPAIVVDCDIVTIDDEYTANTRDWVAERDMLVKEPPPVVITRPDAARSGGFTPTIRWFATATAAELAALTADKAHFNNPQNWRHFREFLPDILWFARKPGEWWGWDRRKQTTQQQLDVFDGRRAVITSYQDRTVSDTIYQHRLGGIMRALRAAVAGKRDALLLTKEDSASV